MCSLSWSNLSLLMTGFHPTIRKWKEIKNPARDWWTLPQKFHWFPDFTSQIFNNKFYTNFTTINFLFTAHVNFEWLKSWLSSVLKLKVATGDLFLNKLLKHSKLPNFNARKNSPIDSTGGANVCVLNKHKTSSRAYECNVTLAYLLILHVSQQLRCLLRFTSRIRLEFNKN